MNNVSEVKVNGQIFEFTKCHDEFEFCPNEVECRLIETRIASLPVRTNLMHSQFSNF